MKYPISNKGSLTHTYTTITCVSIVNYSFNSLIIEGGQVSKEDNSESNTSIMQEL